MSGIKWLERKKASQSTKMLCKGRVKVKGKKLRKVLLVYKDVINKLSNFENKKKYLSKNVA